MQKEFLLTFQKVSEKIFDEDKTQYHTSQNFFLFISTWLFFIAWILLVKWY